ncbi:MAG: 2OG-Fe(II) oxygenase family protein [Actinomycetota bacterium]
MSPVSGSASSELEKERRIGGPGTEIEREIPRIDLHDFDDRFEEIADGLWLAATDVGFFDVVNHGIPEMQVDAAFASAREFFALPEEIKAKRALVAEANAGWEDRAQIRPSTGTPDHKETFQITLPRMDEHRLWPDTAFPSFRRQMTSFAEANRQLGMRILSCFAVRLGFERDFFERRHDPRSPYFQSTLRLLHYYPSTGEDDDQGVRWRAGAHTDYDCLTLLHQRPDQRGLQVCPGHESASGQWTPIEPVSGAITCNVGDMLMRWSDDQLLSTLHRVVLPSEPTPSRYSIAYFCQADGDVMIQGPSRRYPPVSASAYLQERIAANFAE